uniref:Uncharacterized protein n=1 Tax=Fagus sylvatica TaxID=28930 RepID=A0A2N9I064_FAGSY
MCKGRINRKPPSQSKQSGQPTEVPPTNLLLEAGYCLQKTCSSELIQSLAGRKPQKTPAQNAQRKWRCWHKDSSSKRRWRPGKAS